MTDRNQRVVANQRDVVVIGGGQAGLALGYYLRRSDLDWTILDNQGSPGGAWTRTWDSLRLFSPARWSSLPGRLMEGGEDEYPSKNEALEYFSWYEKHYDLNVQRPVQVTGVQRTESAEFPWVVETSLGAIRSKAVVSATGTWGNPVVPSLPGRELFAGLQVHSAHYRNPLPFSGKRVAIVGGGNSAAQILAEVSRVADVLWCTLNPPAFLPDDVDGRYLFDQATIRYRAEQRGLPVPPAASLGDIVMVAPVRDARDRGVLEHQPMFTSMTAQGAVWADGRSERLDAVIWATGFQAALDHLKGLALTDVGGKIKTDGTRAVAQPRLWLVGYGGWTGYASATVIGVGRTARQTVVEINAELAAQDSN